MDQQYAQLSSGLAERLWNLAERNLRQEFYDLFYDITKIVQDQDAHIEILENELYVVQDIAAKMAATKSNKK